MAYKIRFKRRNFLPLLIAFLIVVIQTVHGSIIERTSSVPEPSSTTTENDAVKKWFSAMFGINNELPGNSNGRQNSGSPARTPQYVRNLYDRMVFDEEGDPIWRGTRQRTVGSSDEDTLTTEDGPVTIQAVTRDPIVQKKNGSGKSYLLQFNLEKLWIPSQQLRLAELVFAVDFSRLTGPPSAYSVLTNIIDPDVDIQSSAARHFVAGASVGLMETFRKNFVKVNVTNAIGQNLANGWQNVLFEVSVVQFGDQNSGETVPNRDLEHQEISHLLYLSSHGAHQPVLVLYSAAAESILTKVGQIGSGRRRRGRDAYSTPPRHEGGNHDKECNLIEWRIDLAKLFEDRVVAPEGFYANYCSGPCRNPLLHSRWNATANAHLRSVYNAMWRLEQAKNGTNQPCNVPEPQCVPQSYSSITVVFKADKNFVMKRLAKVIVNSCMCA